MLELLELQYRMLVVEGRRHQKN